MHFEFIFWWVNIMQVALYKLKFILIYRLGYLFMFGATILECYFYCAASVIISAGA